MPQRRYRIRPRATTISAPVGRWTLLRSSLSPLAAPEVRTEQWCRLLLRRYGVMFRDLLANESSAPPWSELIRCYRRLEARGEIRGGRFVADVAGEQFALAEIIPLLRSAANDPAERSLVLSATDPLNLSGRVIPGRRVPALSGNAVVLTDGKVKGLEAFSDVRR
jgi:ATP-dependent helicase Lhr and Lhr-like helicase